MRYGLRRVQSCKFLSTLAASALACCIAPAHSAPPMQFARITAENGLSAGGVMAIVQDAQGFLWLGTEDGLDRYDGSEIRHYVHDRSQSGTLTDNWVSALAQDAQGTLWIGTASAGVVTRNRVTGAFEDLPAVRGEHVRTLDFDAKGRLWIGTRDHGLVMVDREHSQVHQFRNVAQDGATLGSDSIFALTEDTNGGVWIGTQKGLDRLDPVSGLIEHQPLGSWLPAAQRGDQQVTALRLDRRGDLWVGTNAGLLRIARNSGGDVTLYRNRPGDPYSLPSDRIQSIFEDQAQRLWIGTANGLALYETRGNRFETYHHDAADPGSLPDDSVISLYEDSSGLLWVGTKTGGAARWNSHSWSFGHHPRGGDMSFGDANPTAFAVDSTGTLWVATLGEGLAAIDPQGGVTHYRHRTSDDTSLPDDRVMSLLVDHEDSVWAGTMSAGLARLDRRTGHFKLYGANPGDPTSLAAPGIMSLLEDSRDRLWVGTYGGGLASLDRATDRFTRYSVDPNDTATLSSDRATALAEDRSGRIWVGTDAGGLCLLDPESGRFTRFAHEVQSQHGLSADTVYSIRVDQRNRVWVGTRGGGLDQVLGSALAPERISFRNYSEAQGLPNATVYGIEFDSSGRLWLSTNRGLSRLDPDSGAVRNFGRAHGLQGDEFNFGAHYRSHDGELFFGGPGGYNAFYPERLEFDDRPPPLALTAFLKFNEPARLPMLPEQLTNVELGYRDSVVTFEFSALDFTSPEHNRYRYKLEGFDQDWVDGGAKHSVTYTNLAAGAYTFRVKAANSDGIWNDTGLSLPLKVQASPWTSTWARAGYAVVAGLLIFAVWQNQQRRRRREALYARRLEQEVQDHTTQLALRNEELERVNRRLRETSVTDPLTKLGNRRYLHEAMAGLAPDARRTAGEGATPASSAVLLIVDLDHLKPINDQHGHECGDQILITVADILRRCCRASDLLVRWGGDEFVIVNLDADLAEAELLAERIRSAVAKQIFLLPNRETSRTSCSIGFCRLPFAREAPRMLSWEQTLAIADAALYHAKKERNSWIGWAGTAAVAGMSSILEELERDADALERNGLLDVRRPRFRPEDTINSARPQLRRRGDQRVIPQTPPHEDQVPPKTGSSTQ
jgi:diguanylate cyclase (GGDEF)-like protein